MGEVRSPWAPAQRRTLVRGGLAAGVSTAVALWFHLLAGGAMPAPPGLLVPLLLALVVCVLLARVRLAWPRLLVSVGVSQVLFHTLFVLGTAPTHSSAHPHHAALSTTQGSSSSLMVLAHVAAGVVTAALLRHGELVLARLTATVRRLGWRLLRRPTSLPALPRPTAPVTDGRRWAPVIRLLVGTSLTRRGPPRGRLLPTS